MDALVTMKPRRHVVKKGKHIMLDEEITRRTFDALTSEQEEAF